ncbi:hypothetical protein HGP16_14160 [Rhizobium sp. P40RR-XXII]|nr:hypothetical protein [Rhizobium sp. P40RR-XXII]NLS17702.1 hypothetical protein [Rhizobium sp. P40RR-XXII]
MLDASETLFKGNRDALGGFTAREAALACTRLIANLDQITGAEPSSHAS